MDFVNLMCKTAVSANEKWDEVPETVKPIATGGAIIVGLLLSKAILGLGVIAFFGVRAAHKFGVFTDCMAEADDDQKDNSDLK